MMKAVWDVICIWMLAAAAAVWLAVASHGAELLNMPLWAAYLTLIAGTGAACFYGLAYRIGDTADVRGVSKACIFMFFAGFCACFLTGFFSTTHELAPPAGTFGASLAAARDDLVTFIAWAALVGAPLFAFAANGAIVLSLRRSRRAAKPTLEAGG